MENMNPTVSCDSSLSDTKLENGAALKAGTAPVILESFAGLSRHSSFFKEEASPVPSDSVSNNVPSSQVEQSQMIEQLQQKLRDAEEKLAQQEKIISKGKAVDHSLSGSSSPFIGLDTSKYYEGLPVRHDLLDDVKSDVSISMSGIGGAVNEWDNALQIGINPVARHSIWKSGANNPWENRRFSQTAAPQAAARNFTSRSRGRVVNPWQSGWISPELSGTLSVDHLSYQHVSGYQSPPHLSSPTLSTLSPTAPEFTLNNKRSSYVEATSPGQSYAAPSEFINWRRLLDRTVSCNWEYIVNKIIKANEQQASIFLQQKLKAGTAEQKFEIVECIVAHAYALMVNRFGNFLVQRCFEHGTPEQVIAIANTIRGNTLALSMDAFGCHVVQKAFDAVPEEYKALMVHELLRRIPETIIHRYACHVWQKLFELRWSDSPPQIMKYVNNALRGMWHEVALGETGSLVVQNIFENCLEEDKRPCIEEVLCSIDIVAHGQFGNWCIQHICEHGAPEDRGRAIDHVLRYATEYSMDQFASKVVEKCLKIGGDDFLARYLGRVCEARPDRPRLPLIDIASDQYGNYLIQYILTNASAQHREIVAAHIRKHMVSLRGSKFGSRVGLLCGNPAYATRPGPTATTSNSRFPDANNAAPSSAPGPSSGVRYGPGVLI